MAQDRNKGNKIKQKQTQQNSSAARLCMRQRAADQRCGGRPGCLPRTCLAVAYMHHAKQLPHRKGGTTGLMSPRMPRRLASSIAGKLEKPRQLLRNIPSKPMPCSTSGLTASTAMDWYTGYHNTPPSTPVPVREVPLPVFSPISSNVGKMSHCVVDSKYMRYQDPPQSAAAGRRSLRGIRK